MKRILETKNNNQINIRAMIAGCVIAFCLMLLVIFLAFPDHTLDLWFYFSYMTVACTFIPLQTPQVAMDYGARYGEMYGLYGFILIAVLGGIGSCISGMVDYTLVAVISQSKKVAKLKNSKTYNKHLKPIYDYVEKLYEKAPFFILVIAAFTPIPFEPVKLLACIKKYNRLKFILAVFVARTPRYFILGKFQDMVKIPNIYLYGSIVVITMIILVRSRFKKIILKNKESINIMEEIKEHDNIID